MFHTFTEPFAKELFDTPLRVLRDVTKDNESEEGGIQHTGMLGCDRVDGSNPPQVANCPFSEMNLHMGKKGYPTIAYEGTVDHTERVLEVTRGSTARQITK